MEGTQHIRDAFVQLVASGCPESAVGAVAELVAEDQLDRDSFGAVVQQHRVAGSAAFRDALLDLVLHAVRAALRDHRLTRDEIGAIHRLKMIFRIAQGAFFKFRRSAVGDLLCGEMSRILADEQVDLAEALCEVELQRIFDLGYDQFLQLTRPEMSRTVDGLIATVTADGVVTSVEVARIQRQLAALDAVYRLSPAQRIALRRAGWDPGAEA